MILHVVGARPNFVKIAPVIRAVSALLPVARQLLVHTGQHYDDNMSQLFFDELALPRPDFNLGIGSGSHATQTARIMSALEPIMVVQRPDWVVVVGDVNSTLAAALVAAKLSVPVAHLESGLRSFDRRMPEEVNRVVTDHLSTLLLCPTEQAVLNLRTEGIVRGVHLVGDVMEEAVLDNLPRARGVVPAWKSLGLQAVDYALATVHRAANTDDRSRLSSVLACLTATDLPVIFPAHPRTVAALRGFDLRLPENVHLVEPLGYLAMLEAESNARVILTDSGGVQKEAYWLGVRCLTLRDETEWTETLEGGWNQLVGIEPDRVRAALRATPAPREGGRRWTNGRPSERIARLLVG